MSVTQQNRPLRYLVLIIAAGILIWSFYQELRPHNEVGQMEYRMVTGVKDNALEIIMVETEKQFTVIDSDFKEIFEYNDAEVVSRPEQLNLLQTYKDLQYRVSMHQYPRNEKAEFRLSRDNFNKMRFNTNIKYEIDRKVRDSITSIVEM